MTCQLALLDRVGKSGAERAAAALQRERERCVDLLDMDAASHQIKLTSVGRTAP